MSITQSIVDSASVFNSKRIAVMWSGGKNSTVLWDVVSGQMSADPVFIDHGLNPQETHEYMHRMFRQGNFTVNIMRNDEVLSKVKDGRVQLKDGTHDYTMEDPLVYRELFLVPFMKALEKYDLVFMGNRWSRRPDDAYLKYFERSGNTIIARPLLHMKESEIWDYILKNKLDFNDRYKQGYRFVDYAYDGRIDSKPAWEQELDNGMEQFISEKKADMIRKLRALGYI